MNKSEIKENHTTVAALITGHATVYCTVLRALQDSTPDGTLRGEHDATAKAYAKDWAQETLFIITGVVASDAAEDITNER